MACSCRDRSASMLKAGAVDIAELDLLKLDYLNTVTAPLDGMWSDGLIPLSRHWSITEKGEIVGYFCVNSDKALLQFHLPDAFLPQAVDFLRALIGRGTVASAFAGTNEPTFLGLCMDLQRSVSVHTLLYRDVDAVVPRMQQCEGAVFRLARTEDLSGIIDFIQENTGNGGVWLKGYMDNLITRGESYILEQDSEMIGLGECRVSDTQMPYADLGMIVAKGRRGQGLGSMILALMKNICYGRQLRPICSTRVENIAARKAIERAGFLAKNRILHLHFS